MRSREKDCTHVTIYASQTRLASNMQYPKLLYIHQVTILCFHLLSNVLSPEAILSD